MTERWGLVTLDGLVKFILVKFGLGKAEGLVKFSLFDLDVTNIKKTKKYMMTC